MSATNAGQNVAVAALYAKARAIKEKEDQAKRLKEAAGKPARELTVAEKRNAEKAKVFKRAWGWGIGFFAWLL